LKNALVRNLQPFLKMSGPEVREQRYRRFRGLGNYIEG
jgi:acetyl-CoA carboxylase alpha subunit